MKFTMRRSKGNLVTPTRSKLKAKGISLTSTYRSHVSKSTDRSTTKLDQMKLKVDDIGFLNKYRFHLMVAMVSFIHVFSILYLLAISAIHFLLTSKIEVQILRLYNRYAVVAVYGFLAALHMQSLYILCLRVCRLHRKQHQLIMYCSDQLTDGNILQRFWRRSYNWYHTFLGPVGLFGQYGEYYEIRISLRELVEVPAQILQAYYMSKQITYTSISFAYTMIIVLNCITSPLMLSSGKHTVRRQLLVFLDGLFDFTFSVLFQFLIMGIATYDYIVQDNPGIAAHEVHGFRIIHIASQVGVTSFLDLLTQAMPFFFNATLLRSLIHSLCKSRLLLENPEEKETEYQFSLEKIRPSYPRLGRTMDMLNSQGLKRFFKFSGVVSGVTLLAIAGEAYYRAPCAEKCSLEIRPWLASPCQCVVRSYNCISENITGDEQLEDEINSLPDSIAYLFIRQCPISKPPSKAALSRFQNLERLEFFDTKMRSWDYIMDTFSENFIILAIDGSEFTEVPPGLKNLPESILSLTFLLNNITQLPPPQEMKWDNLVKVAISYFQLTEFPWQLLKLPGWERLDVDGVDMRNFKAPLDLSEKVSVQMIYLQWNNLQEVPMDLLLKFPSLITLRLDGNNITSLPVDAPSLRLFQRLTTFTLSETPLCSPAYRPEMENYLKQIPKLLYADVCPTICARACPPYQLQNSYCDRACLSQACGYDGGDCHFYHHTPKYLYNFPPVFH